MLWRIETSCIQQRAIQHLKRDISIVTNSLPSTLARPLPATGHRLADPPDARSPAPVRPCGKHCGHACSTFTPLSRRSRRRDMLRFRARPSRLRAMMVVIHSGQHDSIFSAQRIAALTLANPGTQKSNSRTPAF